MVVTSRSGETEALAREAARHGMQRVFVAGGDGTVNEAANGLVGTRTALGILPIGTGNCLARELELPADPERAAELLRDGVIREVRPGRINGRCFVAVAGIGVDAAVALLYAGPGRRPVPLGVFSYLGGILETLVRYRYPEFVVEGGGGRHRARGVWIPRAACRFGFSCLHPEARLEDPFLRVLLVEHGGPISYLGIGLRLGAGMDLRSARLRLDRTDAGRAEGERYGGGGVREVMGDFFKIEGGDAPIHVDGEPHGTLPAEVSIAGEGLLLIYPSKAWSSQRRAI